MVVSCSAAPPGASCWFLNWMIPYLDVWAVQVEVRSDWSVGASCQLTLAHLHLRQRTCSHAHNRMAILNQNFEQIRPNGHQLQLAEFFTGSFHQQEHSGSL